MEAESLEFKQAIGLNGRMIEVLADLLLTKMPDFVLGVTEDTVLEQGPPQSPVSGSSNRDDTVSSAQKVTNWTLVLWVNIGPRESIEPQKPC